MKPDDSYARAHAHGGKVTGRHRPHIPADPMLVSGSHHQRTSAYNRRQTIYRSSGTVMDFYAPPKAHHKIPAATPSQSKSVATAAKSQPAAPATQAPSTKPHWHKWRNLALYTMAGIVFAVGVVVSWSGARTNQHVAAQVKQAQKKTNDSVSDVVTPSTVKPSANEVARYAVSPNVPKYIDIPKLDIHTRVLPQGLTRQNQLQAPWNIYDTGWYNGSSQPGENGAMLVDGHSGVGNTHGVFYELASLAAGDQVSVTRGDGKQFAYTVVKVQTVDVQDVDMASTLVSADTSKPGLNLITCAGERIPGTTTLSKRVLVYAVLK